MSDKYILDGHEAKPCYDLMHWAHWFASANRRVDETIVGDKRVSTVFIGLNHQYGEGPPLLFETMIFAPDNDGEYQTRCTTWEEAEEMHRKAVESLGSPSAKA
jgi:hypothetical protein